MRPARDSSRPFSFTTNSPNRINHLTEIPTHSRVTLETVIDPRWYTIRNPRLASFHHSFRIGFVSPSSIPPAPHPSPYRKPPTNWLRSVISGTRCVPALAPGPRPATASIPSPHPLTTDENIHACIDSPRFLPLASRLLSFHRSVHPGPCVRGFTHAPKSKGRHP